VQILVVVASIQRSTLKTEVGKGSMSTEIVHGLVGPKTIGNSLENLYYIDPVERESGSYS
jgi:hypothetical protein